MYHMHSFGPESDKVSLIMLFLIFVYCCCSFLVSSVVSNDMIGLLAHNEHVHERAEFGKCDFIKSKGKSQKSPGRQPPP